MLLIDESKGENEKMKVLSKLNLGIVLPID